MKIRIENPAKGVYHAQFATRYECAATFLRLQEFYESPYRGFFRKYFTLEEYMDRYAKETGNFTYTTDWEGFNVPGNIVRQFFGPKSQFWNDILEKEMDLYGSMERVIASRKRFYLIGTSDEDGHDAVEHEYAHGYWYLNQTYKADQLSALNDISEKDMLRFEKKLLAKGYRKSVVLDELQAYLSTSTPKDLKEMLGNRLPKRVIQKCQTNFASYNLTQST